LIDLQQLEAEALTPDAIGRDRSSVDWGNMASSSLTIGQRWRNSVPIDRITLEHHSAFWAQGLGRLDILYMPGSARRYCP
jgi:hypothetical protein